MSSSEKTPYPKVPPRADFPAIERSVLARWEEGATFESSIEARPADQEYVFYDGPPFANGLPHHGHLLTGYVKDVVPRYQTMRGKRVDRRFGWDCHGLPAEMETLRTSTQAVANLSCGTPPSGRKPLLVKHAGSTSKMTTRPWTFPTWNQ